jgi:hypothetical protein
MSEAHIASAVQVKKKAKGNQYYKETGRNKPT